MASRLSLQELLEELLGSTNVYYQPPTSVTIKYPAIVYSKSNIDKKYANDKPYMQDKTYELIVMDQLPDNPVIDKLLKLQYCRYVRHYTADNLNHDVLELYY